MWCHDIGREQAANKPLLKTVFQVMMRLFSPRKTTLTFFIRDKTKVDDQSSMLSFSQDDELKGVVGSRSLESLLILLNMAFVWTLEVLEPVLRQYIKVSPIFSFHICDMKLFSYLYTLC